VLVVLEAVAIGIVQHRRLPAALRRLPRALVARWKARKVRAMLRANYPHVHRDSNLMHSHPGGDLPHEHGPGAATGTEGATAT
jgi:hypothetical protein